MKRSAFVDLVATHQADPALRDGLRALAPDTTRWPALVVLLRERSFRMGLNDSWIAAAAMALGVPVLTRDTGFPHLDSLQVIHA